MIKGWDPPIMPVPSRRIRQAINVSMVKSQIPDLSIDDPIQSDLDSHANMIVLGKQCFIISYYVIVLPYSIYNVTCTFLCLFFTIE
jgi:hypothetical protein